MTTAAGEPAGVVGEEERAEAAMRAVRPAMTTTTASAGRQKCRGRDSNPQMPLRAADFKSAAYASSATPAGDDWGIYLRNSFSFLVSFVCSPPAGVKATVTLTLALPFLASFFFSLPFGLTLSL